MKLAFYAPLKPPHHPIPSGDRAMAQALISALTRGGFSVELASDLRSREPQGDADTQIALIKQADAIIPSLITEGERSGWRAWVSYHNYYKAPDLLGPKVSAALDIPYLQIESTRARKRLRGPWAAFAQAAEAASDAARVIFYLTRHDAEALKEYVTDDQTLLHLAPFLALEKLPELTDWSGAMLSVGMMRNGDKLASYQVIAETLALLENDWQLDVVGDGGAGDEVRALMAPFGRKVRFLGKLDATRLSSVYAQARLLFWPGVNEAFGMTYLEAQAHGLPVVAQDRPGVRDVLAPGRYPDPMAGPAALAEVLQKVSVAPRDLGRAAREHVARYHLMSAATETLKHGLAKAGLK